MKNIPEFEDFIRENASEAFKYHMERGLGITNSVFRIGSDAYNKLFGETKEWWDTPDDQRDDFKLSDKQRKKAGQILRRRIERKKKRVRLNGLRYMLFV